VLRFRSGASHTWMAPKAPPSKGEWLRKTAERLSEQGKDLSSLRIPTEDQFQDAIEADVEGTGTLSLQPADPDGIDPRQTISEARLLLHRRAKDVVFSTGFNPARHTIMIEGRPVQVLSEI
jgi:hypothetical protein